MSPTTLSFLYRIMVGLCGFSLGLSIILAYHWVVMGVRGRTSYYLWAGTMLGYTLIIAALFPLVLLARAANAPFTWQAWMFLGGLALKAVCFTGMYIRRLRHKDVLLP